MNNTPLIRKLLQYFYLSPPSRKKRLATIFLCFFFSTPYLFPAQAMHEEDNDVRHRFINILRDHEDPAHEPLRQNHWDNINDLNNLISIPLEAPLPAPTQLRGTDPFVLSNVSYDDSLLERQGDHWCGRVNGEDIDFILEVNWVTGEPQIILRRGMVQENPLENVQIRKGFTIKYSSNLNTETLNECLQDCKNRLRAWPQIHYSGLMENGSQLKIRFDQMQREAQQNPSLHSLALCHVLYGIDTIQHRLGIFCEFTLPGFGSRFELLKEGDCNDSANNTPIQGLFYDGVNIYDTLTIPSWLNKWTHNQLTLEDREKLILATFHTANPRPRVAINPHDLENNQAIPVNQRYIPQKSSYRKISTVYNDGGNLCLKEELSSQENPDRQTRDAIYSNGHGDLFLASCFRQKWNSFLSPADSYKVEYFANTTIPRIFEGNILPHAGTYNQQWQEGLYLQETTDTSIWRRSYSTHELVRYELTPNLSRPSQPQGMDDETYYNHLLHISPDIRKQVEVQLLMGQLLHSMREPSHWDCNL